MAKTKAERFTVAELDAIRLALMHIGIYTKDAKSKKLVDRIQCKVERFIIERGRKLQTI